MAIELCSENSSVVMSPRISFSHELSQMETVPVEQYIESNSSSSKVDFDFCVFRESFDQESSSADELFCDGKILPIEIKKKLPPTRKLEPPLAPQPPQQSHENDNIFNATKSLKINENSRETKMVVSESDEKQNSKSFWGFKRSSSLNCGSSYARSLCPLPPLSRSNSTGSTGSATSVKRSNKQHSHKFSSVASMKQSQSSPSTGHQKPPLKKNYGSHGNGVRINPVLNVPTASLFGLGSIFSSTKEKSKKK